MKKRELSLLIIIAQALIGGSKRIELHFSKYNSKLNDFGVNAIERHIDSCIGVELEIGSPPQSLVLNIAFNEYLLWVIGVEANSTAPPFRLSQSTTYKNESNYISILKGSKLLNSKDISDSISIRPKRTVPNMKFQYATLIENSIENSGLIGLDIQPVSLGPLVNSNFIKQLRAKREISSYAFMIKYTSSKEGELIIGEYPHEYSQSQSYLRDSMKVYHPIMADSRLKWGLTFTSITYDNTAFESKVTALFQAEFGFILGTAAFHKLILQSFFTQLLAANTCTAITYTTFLGYECDKSAGSFISALKEVVFDIDKTTKFSFKGKELFIEEENGKMLFLVLFSIDESKKEWILGEPFFKKHSIVFDQDKKLICYYGDTGNRGSPIVMTPMLWAISISFIVLSSFLLCYFVKRRRLAVKRKLYEAKAASYECLNEAKA